MTITYLNVIFFKENILNTVIFFFYLVPEIRISQYIAFTYDYFIKILSARNPPLEVFKFRHTDLRVFWEI